MPEDSQEIIVHHVLHDKWYGRTKAIRVDEKCIAVCLPDLHGEEYVHVISMDARDKRTLFVFDGGIPSGGLPKAGVVVRYFQIGQLRTHFRNIRKSKVGEDQPLFRIDGIEAVIDLKRNFLLLPHGQLLARTYRSRSFSPRYLFVRVDKRSTPERVTILTTSG